MVLSDLRAGNTGSRNRISWTTAHETDMTSYTVERSVDGARFGSMQEVAAKNKAWQYESFDNSPATGNTYYRLKMKNADGSFRYSGTVSAFKGVEGTVVIIAQPTPVHDVVKVRIGGSEGGNVHLLDITGRSIASVAVRDGQAQINMSRFASGTYFLRYTNSVISKTIKISKR